MGGMCATAPSAQTCWWVPPCPGEWWPRGARQVALAMWHCVLSCTRCQLCCPPRGTAHVGFAVLCVPGGLTLLLSFSCFSSFSYLGYRLGWEEQAAHVCLLGGGVQGGCRSAELVGWAPIPDLPLCSLSAPAAPAGSDCRSIGARNEGNDASAGCTGDVVMKINK